MRGGLGLPGARCEEDQPADDRSEEHPYHQRHRRHHKVPGCKKSNMTPETIIT